MDKHTPGPWGFVMNYNWPFRQDVHVMAKGFGLIATVSVDGGLPHIAGKQRANARLIAAAPELLEAMEAVHAFLTDPNIGTWQYMEYAFYSDISKQLKKIDAALAKARGEQV